MRSFREADIIASVREGLQFIACTHPADFIRHLAAAYAAEPAGAAKDAMGQLLLNARMSALDKRPMCQDTGTVNVFVKIGVGARIDSTRGLQEIVDEGVRQAYRDPANPLRASIVADPLFLRPNTRDNTPAVVAAEIVAGDGLEMTLAAKGGGSENKARFAVLNPADDVASWVVDTVATLGAGWCPPGVLGIGVGGTCEKAMLLAKEALMEPLDMSELRRRGPRDKTEALRLEICDRVNALGLGAQGLGGATTVLDVKIRTFPTHAASMPVALIPNCAATRHIHLSLDGSGPARIEMPDLADWPQAIAAAARGSMRAVDLDRLTRDEVATWQPGERLLLSGRLLTGRDAAHRRMAEMMARGEALPVPLEGRMIYYVGPVDPVRGEAVGPAGPTTANRMDRYSEAMLGPAGLLGMIGKAERDEATRQAIARHGAVYLIAVGGAGYLISKAIKQARVLAFEDLGMEAIRELQVEDMPVIVAIDARGASIHETGPRAFRARRAGAATS
ncbi:MAG: fumarate hydratase [Hyphomicrobiaceae bacterium]|nr:fumarate hydratase [Hyphomicrobiaceae bacterium]